MSHRGKNSNANTLQVWDGTRWKPLNNLSLLDSGGNVSLSSGSGDIAITTANLSLTGNLQVSGAFSAPLVPYDKAAGYVLVLGDRDTCLSYNSASGGSFTVPPNSSVAFPVGTCIYLYQKGAGILTVAPGSGVTIVSTMGLKTGGQYAMAMLWKESTDNWVLTGDRGY